MTDFTTIKYLASGNKRQQLAFQELNSLQIFEKLEAFNPILAGTIPIEIDIPESDLDIICECKHLDIFQNTLIRLFSKQENFKITHNSICNIPSIICNFKTPHFEVEIFGQNIPVKKQHAYRHMLVEYAILQQKDSAFKKAIMQLKKDGFKTEPAFAKLLGLSGNPYEALLLLENDLL